MFFTERQTILARDGIFVQREHPIRHDVQEPAECSDSLGAHGAAPSGSTHRQPNCLLYTIRFGRSGLHIEPAQLLHPSPSRASAVDV